MLDDDKASHALLCIDNMMFRAKEIMRIVSQLNVDIIQLAVYVQVEINEDRMDSISPNLESMRKTSDQVLLLAELIQGLSTDVRNLNKR